MEKSSYRSYIQIRFILDISAKKVHPKLKMVDEDVRII